MFSDRIEKLVRQTLPAGYLPAPVDVQILPLNACNARCCFCPLFSLTETEKKSLAPRFEITRDRLDFDLYASLIDALDAHGLTQRIHFTGGEPLMHPDLSRMVALANARLNECETIVVTNGILLGRHAEALAASGVDKVSVSLNAGSPESFQAMEIGKAAQFESVIEGMKSFGGHRSASQQLAVTAVITRHNHHEILKMIESAARGGADVLTVVPLVRFRLRGPNGDAIDANRELALDEAQMRALDSQWPSALEAASRFSIGLYRAGEWDLTGSMDSTSMADAQPCYSGHVFAILHPDGSLRGCCNCETVLGNLKDAPFDEIWRGDAYQTYREQALAIPQQGAPSTCACDECGYIYENRMIHEWLNG